MKKIKKTIYSFIYFLSFICLFSVPIYADSNSIEDTINDMTFTTDSSHKDAYSEGTDMQLQYKSDETQVTFWNKLFDEYKNLIVGISGVCTLTFLLMLIHYIHKLLISSGNPQERNSALKGILWTGIATGLGSSVFTITVLSINALL